MLSYSNITYVKKMIKKVYKLLFYPFLYLFVLSSSFALFSQEQVHFISEDSKILVTFFSRADENYGVGVVEKGNTQVLGEFIASHFKADVFHIKPLKPYPKEYKACTEVALKERPALLKDIENLSEYDIVFLGYPNWWGDLPMTMYTFLENHDFSSKVIIPFCTHEGRGSSNTVKTIKGICAKATVLDAFTMKGQKAQKLDEKAKKEVMEWLNKLVK